LQLTINTLYEFNIIAIIVANALFSYKGFNDHSLENMNFTWGVYVQVNKSGFYHPVFFMQT
jgi:hypothetical protein